MVRERTRRLVGVHRGGARARIRTRTVYRRFKRQPPPIEPISTQHLMWRRSRSSPSISSRRGAQGKPLRSLALLRTGASRVDARGRGWEGAA